MFTLSTVLFQAGTKKHLNSQVTGISPWVNRLTYIFIRFLSNRNISLFSELKDILISRIYFISCTGMWPHVGEMTEHFGPINAYEGARAAATNARGPMR